MKIDLSTCGPGCAADFVIGFLTLGGARDKSFHRPQRPTEAYMDLSKLRAFTAPLPRSSSIDESAHRVAVTMGWALGAGLFVTTLWNSTHWTACLMWAGASSTVGWLLGFLFGIPRSLAKAPHQGLGDQGSQADQATAKDQVLAAAKATAEQADAANTVARAAADKANAAKTAATTAATERTDAVDIAAKKAEAATALADQAATQPEDASQADAAKVAAEQANAAKALAEAATEKAKAATTAAATAATEKIDAEKIAATSADAAKAAKDKANGQAHSTFGVNTNLEEISDWLTKIIVGVTLVELGKTQGQLAEAAKLISQSLGGEHEMSFSYALMLYFSLSGFLWSYLLTRLYLQKAFQDVG